MNSKLWRPKAYQHHQRWPWHYQNPLMVMSNSMETQNASAPPKWLWHYQKPMIAVWHRNSICKRWGKSGRMAKSGDADINRYLVFFKTKYGKVEGDTQAFDLTRFLLKIKFVGNKKGVTVLGNCNNVVPSFLASYSSLRMDRRRGSWPSHTPLLCFLCIYLEHVELRPASKSTDRMAGVSVLLERPILRACP